MSLYQYRCDDVTLGYFILFCNSACCWTVQWQPANREAGFKSASVILTLEERQMLRLHPKKGCDTLQHLTPCGSHQGICTRIKTDIPKCTPKLSAVFYLLFTYLVINVYGIEFGLFFFFFCFLVFGLVFFLIIVFGNVNILESRLTLQKGWPFFVIQLYFSYNKNRNIF